ncbi:MAG: helix-hairpin-helix domain-containing protein, partial [Myxococcota bacterium]|nr:helix-hairpin-helix domain-containing protein [Myxococcota bacterium]
MDNKYYAQILSDVALLLQIKGANRYKIRAYQNASRAIGGLNEPVEDVLARGELTDIDGVGKSIA